LVVETLSSAGTPDILIVSYFEHVGGTEGIEIDLARSLAADLRNTRGG